MAAQTPQEFWRPIVNDFNPFVSQVRPDDVARFFVDRRGDDPTSSRLQRLKLDLLNSVGQPRLYKGLLTGPIGSGKTSELVRLGQELSAEFFVVWFDAELSLTTEKTNHFDVLLGMGLAAHAAARAARLDPSDRPANNLVKSLATFVRKYEERKGFSLQLNKLVQQVFAFALGTVATAVGGPPAAAAAGAAVDAIGQALKLDLNVRDELVGTLELPANRVAVVGALNRVIEEVGRKAGKPVLIITDGLDKVRAPGRAQMLFAQNALLTEPACALVYSAPIEFYYRLEGGQVTSFFDKYWLLPNPPVRQRPPTGANWQAARQRSDDGLKVMREVVAKRCEPHGDLGDLIEPGALDSIAESSGGVMRELVRSFREAATLAQLQNKMRIDGAIADRVVVQQRREIEARLNMEHRDALRQVLQNGALSGGSFEETEDELLRSVHLLSYEDESGSWFDAHPSAFRLL